MDVKWILLIIEKSSIITIYIIKINIIYVKLFIPRMYGHILNFNSIYFQNLV